MTTQPTLYLLAGVLNSDKTAYLDTRNTNSFLRSYATKNSGSIGYYVTVNNTLDGAKKQILSIIKRCMGDI